MENRVFLAPMEGVNDICFRILCKRAGAGLTWTGMINSLSREKLILDDKPVLQLFSNSEKGIKEFMKKYDSKVSGWDFNLGCPVVRAKKSGVGSYLRDLKVIEKILKLMRRNTKKLLFVKIRKSSYALKVLKIAEKYCDMIIVHGRTLKQGYSEESDVKWCENFKKKSSIPVVYSGDVRVDNVGGLLNKFDYVMVGRGAMGNPGIFFEMMNSPFNNTILTHPPTLNYGIIKSPTPSKKDRHFNFKDYLKLAVKYKLKFNQIKQQALWFCRGKIGSKKLREKISRCKDVKELKKVI